MDNQARLLIAAGLGALAGACVSSQVRNDVPGWLGALVAAVIGPVVDSTVTQLAVDFGL